jgi:hypothetical protein
MSGHVPSSGRCETRNSDSRLKAIAGWWSNISRSNVVPDRADPIRKNGWSIVMGLILAAVAGKGMGTAPGRARRGERHGTSTAIVSRRGAENAEEGTREPDQSQPDPRYGDHSAANTSPSAAPRLCGRTRSAPGWISRRGAENAEEGRIPSRTRSRSPTRFPLPGHGPVADELGQNGHGATEWPVRPQRRMVRAGQHSREKGDRHRGGAGQRTGHWQRVRPRASPLF